VNADDPRLAPWAIISRHSVARAQRAARQSARWIPICRRCGTP